METERRPFNRSTGPGHKRRRIESATGRNKRRSDSALNISTKRDEEDGRKKSDEERNEAVEGEAIDKEREQDDSSSTKDSVSILRDEALEIIGPYIMETAGMLEVARIGSTAKGMEEYRCKIRELIAVVGGSFCYGCGAYRAHLHAKSRINSRALVSVKEGERKILISGVRVADPVYVEASPEVAANEIGVSFIERALSNESAGRLLGPATSGPVHLKVDERRREGDLFRRRGWRRLKEAIEDIERFHGSQLFLLGTKEQIDIAQHIRSLSIESGFDGGGWLCPLCALLIDASCYDSCICQRIKLDSLLRRISINLSIYSDSYSSRKSA